MYTVTREPMVDEFYGFREPLLHMCILVLHNKRLGGEGGGTLGLKIVLD